MWSKRGLYLSPWRWGWLVVLLVAVLCDLSPQSSPFDQLKTELLRLKTQVGELQSKINSLEQSLLMSKKLAEESKSQIASLQTELENSQSQINALMMSSGEAVKSSESLQELVTTLQKQLSTSYESLQSLKEYIGRLEREAVVVGVAAGLTGAAVGLIIGYMVWEMPHTVKE